MAEMTLRSTSPERDGNIQRFNAKAVVAARDNIPAGVARPPPFPFTPPRLFFSQPCTCQRRTLGGIKRASVTQMNCGRNRI